MKRLQLDQAAHWCVICGSYSCPGLDGVLGEEKLVLPPPLLYLLSINLHFDAYCCSCDIFWCEVSITSAWLCSKMLNTFLSLSCACCAHCRRVCEYSTGSTQSCGLEWLTAQSLVSCQFLIDSCIFFHLLAGNCSERLIDGTLKGLYTWKSVIFIELQWQESSWPDLMWGHCISYLLFQLPVVSVSFLLCKPVWFKIINWMVRVG